MIEDDRCAAMLRYAAEPTDPLPMTDSPEERKHFTHAVAQLGERQDVVASRAIFNTRGLKVVDQGAAINQRLYQRLMQHALAAPIEDSVVSADGVTGEALGSAAASILAQTPFFARLAHDSAARKTLLNVLETVPLPDAMALQLTVARAVRPEIYHHLVRTALVCAWLAMAQEKSRYDIGMAAAAGLLHDIGMLHVDPVLLQPEHRLNRDLRRQLYAHPLISTALVERHHQYAREVVRAIAEHQEYLDGSGYPRGLAADAISPLGRIVALAQVVAAMFAPGRGAPEMRLSVLLRMNTHRYDEAMAMQLVALAQPQRDVMSAGLDLLDDPVALLCDIDAALLQWPLDLGAQSEPSPARQAGLALVSEHAVKLRRAMAGAGAAPEQLAQLGTDALDESLRAELALLTREACWQLRSLAREARRRWRSQADEVYPAALQAWLDQVDALFTRAAHPGGGPASAGPAAQAAPTAAA